jgi:hypothetical protein
MKIQLPKCYIAGTTSTTRKKLLSLACQLNYLNVCAQNRICPIICPALTNKEKKKKREEKEKKKA